MIDDTGSDDTPCTQWTRLSPRAVENGNINPVSCLKILNPAVD
jgi:hypothetical protein